MNNQHSLYKYVLALILVLTGMQGVCAQDAFYIYRNDGNFDGFFFDQVKRMGYSKTDLLGNDHDIYVVQEVETADSLYRIPLAAIDSIGFQQPEIILSPKLKNMAELNADGKCMSDYVIKVEALSDNYNYFTLEFDLNTPEELLPQSKDVIVDFYNPLYKREGVKDEDYSGFSGKVQWSGKEKSKDGYHYMVYTEPLESLSDVFVQFISTEEVAEDENGHQTRRLAGWNPGNVRKGLLDGQGSVNGTILDIDLPLKRDFSVGKGTVTVELGVKLKSRLAATYKITKNDFFIKTLSIHEAELKSALAGKYDGDFEAQIVGLPERSSSIKFPANLPIFQTRPAPNAFLRLKGEMGARIDLPAVRYWTKQSFLVDKDMRPMMSFSYDTNGPVGKLEESIFEGTDLSLYVNGSAQIGVKLSANIESNDWLKDIFSTGLYCDLYLGPQVEGKVELKESVKDLIDGTTNLYQLMKGSNVNVAGLAANMEVKGKLKMFNDDEAKTFLEYNKKFWDATWYLFPDLSKSEAHFDTETGDIVATVRATRPVFVPTKLGFGVFDQEKQCVAKDFNSINYFISEKLANEGTFKFPNLNCGPYNVRPVLQVLGMEVPADPTFNIVVKPVLVQGNDSTKESFHLGPGEDKIEIPFKTNAKQVEVFMLDASGKRMTPAEGFYEISEPGTGVHERILTLNTDKNDLPLPQEWNVLLCASTTGRYETYEAVDTIGIVQSGGNVVFTGMVVNAYGVGKQTSHRYGYTSWDGPFDSTLEEDFVHEQLVVSQNLEATRVGDLIYCRAHIVYRETDTRDESGTDKPEDGIYEHGLRTHKVTDTGDVSFTLDLSSPGKMCIYDGRYVRNWDEYHLTDIKIKWWNTRNNEVTHERSEYSKQTSRYNAEFTWDGPIPFREEKSGRLLCFELKGRDIFSRHVERQQDTYTSTYDLKEGTGTSEEHFDITYQSGAPDDDNSISIQLSY